MRLKNFLPLLAAMLLFAPTNAQTVSPGSSYSYYLFLSDSTALQYVSSSGTQVFPVFNDGHVNAVLNNCRLYKFEKVFQSSRFPYMRHFWYVLTDYAHLPQDLQNANAQLFPYYEQAFTPTLCYTPNDFGPVTGGPMDYLNFVNARQAWDVNQGDSNVVIGVADNYVDINNPDLKQKLVPVIGSNYLLPGANEPAHGTMVCGYAAGGTDNGIGYPAMGFNCKLDFTSNPYNYDDIVMDLSVRGRKVVNGSWYNWSDLNPDFSSYPSNQFLYNEMYENGTTAVFAAGNGDPAVDGPNSFLFPASYDHNISVSSVGWLNPYGGANAFNQQYVHVKNVGDTPSHNHNVRVDICAPALQLAGLVYDPNDTSKHYQSGDGWGTSFASPIVAGTVGLMLSEKACLSPYQREWLLKKNANMDSIANKPENIPYLTKIGAGLLDAGKTLNKIQTFDCNDSATQTFVIKGVKINTRCKPGYSSNGVKPVLIPELANGTPPYTYRWMPMAQNQANLDYLNIANPTVIASSGNNLLRYLLTVYDNSPIQKVASKLIEIHLLADSTKYDLAMRDAYADAMEEPNAMMNVDPRDWNVWESPDVWNRQQNDSIMVHQNPEYFNNAPNYLYTVVRNIGCKASPATSRGALYWTLASTGETWPYAWDGTDSITNVSTGQKLPAGGNIYGSTTDFYYVSGTPLQPGDTILKVHPWYPPNPQTYNNSLTGNTLAVCILSRIMDLPTNPGFYLPEVYNVTKNVVNNNNIVTRNLTVTNLDTGNKAGHRHMIVFGNPENFTATYSLQLITDRDIQLHYAGNLSQYVYVTLHLGDLFTLWQANGGKGNYASINATEKTVTYDPSTPLRLDGIRLSPGEKYYIFLDFTIRNKTNGFSPIIDQRIHVRQLASDGKTEYVSGDVSFAMNISTNGQYRTAKKANTLESNITVHQYTVYPNPVSNQLNIQLIGKDKAGVDIIVFDITGKIVIKAQGINLSKGQSHSVNTSALPNGAYLIQINDNSGYSETFKITKTN